MKEIPKIMDMSEELEVKLANGTSLKIKFDGAFRINKKCILYEIKGYGDNTNDVLSAIMAAQMSKETKRFKNSFYYYIGVNSSKSSAGLKREDFFDKERVKIYPYVEWAESKYFIKFYGIVDIDRLLKEIKHL